MCIDGIARVAQGLRNGKVCVVELYILAYETYAYFLLAGFYAPHHAFPFRKVGRGCVYAKLPADNVGKTGLLQHQRRFVKAGESDVFYDAVQLHVAEEGYLFEYGILERLVAAEDYYIGVYAHALKLLYGMLGGLGLVLIGAAEEGDEGNVYEQAVLPAYLQGYLPHSLYKGLGLYIAYGAAYLGYDHIGVCLLAHTVYEILYFVGYVGYDLHCGTKEFSAALLIQHVPVYLTGGKIGILIQIFVDKTLVVTQIKVCFGAVRRYIYLAVLIRAHGSRVHVYIWIQLLCCYLETAVFEQPAERCRGDALAKAGYHAAGNEDVFSHGCCSSSTCMWKVCFGL